MARKRKIGFTVLWATDASEGSHAAVPLLRRLILSATNRLVVLTVAPQPLLSAARPDPVFLTQVTPVARRDAMKQAEQLAHQEAMRLVPSVKVEAIARWGNPIQQILAAARALPADLVVLAAKGHSNLGLILLGSVSQGVVQHSTKPVLVARPGQHNLNRIIVGYDASKPANDAVAFLRHLSPPPQTRFHLVYVVEPFSVPAGTPAAYRRQARAAAAEIAARQRSEAQHAMDTATALLRNASLRVTTEVLTGDSPVTMLDEIARQERAGLIVVGSRKPSPARHYLLGSTAEKLVRHSSTSVLVVR